MPRVISDMSLYRRSTALHALTARLTTTNTHYSKEVFPNINCTQAAEIDLDLQTRPSEAANTSSVWIWRKSVQRFPRYPPKTLFFVRGDLDFWPWHSNSSNWGTKHVFPVNLAQIRSADPDIFHTQTKKSHTVPKTEPYAVHYVR